MPEHEKRAPARARSRVAKTTNDSIKVTTFSLGSVAMIMAVSS